MRTTMKSTPSSYERNLIRTSAARLKKINYSAWFMILPGLILMYFVVWRPIISGAYLSLFDLKGYEPTAFVGLDNYRQIMSDTLFLQTLRNTCAYVLWSLVIGFLPPMVLAIMVNEMVHGQGFFKFSLYFPAIVPTIAVSYIWYFLYQPGEGGLLNMFLGVFGIPPQQWLQNPSWTIPLIIISMTWKGFGSTMLLYLAALQGVSQDIYEAAKIDGAGIRRRLWHITLPQIAPIITLFFIRQIIGVFQVMVEPMAMTGGGPNNASVSLSLQGYNYAFMYFQTDKALALGVVTFLILIGLTFVYFAIDKRLDT